LVGGRGAKRADRPARGSELIGLALAAAAFVLAIVAYYLTFGTTALLSMASGIGTPATTVDPVGFGLVTGTIIYGGPLWALAAAVLVYRLFGPTDSTMVRTRFADGLIVVGCGLMMAVLCALPASVLASETAVPRAFMTGAALGFLIGCGLAGVFVARSRIATRRELSMESGDL